LAVVRTCFDWSAKCGCYLIGLRKRWVESTVDFFHSTLEVFQNPQIREGIYKCTESGSQINAMQICVCILLLLTYSI